MSYRYAYATSWVICAGGVAWTILHTIATNYGDPPNYCGVAKAAVVVWGSAGYAGFISGDASNEKRKAKQ